MPDLPRLRSALAISALLVAAGCGDDDTSSDAAGADLAAITVTTNILGDVVTEVVGDLAVVTTIMPVGADPHDFQASAREAAAMRDADLVIVNGAGFEEALLDVIEGAEADGVPVHEAIASVDALEAVEDDHVEEGEEDEHGHSGNDPHFFTDPTRMADAIEGMVDAIVEHVPEVDEEALRSSADAYLEELNELDAEVEATLDAVTVERRVLLTNHEVFGYFADRYDFEVVGAVIPGGSTGGGGSAAVLAELVEIIADRNVPAIFADTSSPAELAETLAAEVDDIEVVELFSESLGEPGSGGETYLEMVRTNADRIAEALA